MDDSNKVLGKIFGSRERAKVLRFFMQNASSLSTATHIAEKTGLTPRDIAREASALQSLGVLRRKLITDKPQKGKKKGKRVPAWYLNEQFPYRGIFESFFYDALRLDQGAIVRILMQIGRIKFVALSGIFTDVSDARVDVLIVGDILQPAALARAVKKVEHMICRDLKLAFLTTGDFIYRKNVNDRLLRDVFDYTHVIPVDKLQNGPGVA